MKTNYAKWIFFSSQFLVLLCIQFYFPFLHNQINLLQTPPLAGVSPEITPHELTIENWLGEKYQKYYQTKVLDNDELKPLLLRARNQLLFDIFHKSANANLLIGKDNYLFDKEGIQAYLGKDFLGEELIKEKIRKLTFIQDYLETQGTKLLVFIPPAKASMLPEKLPSPFDKYVARINNRKIITQALTNQHIDQINFAPILKTVHPEPFLYPKGGLHWSHVASTLAADTLRKRLESLLGRNLPAFQIQGYERTSVLRPPDNDLANTLNLSKNYPTDSMFYPVILYEKDSLAYTPRVAVIGDSYYRMMFDMGFHQKFFSEKSLYWHYFTHEVSPEFPLGKKLDKSHMNIPDIFKDKEVLILEVGESNLDNFGFGFIEKFYEQIVLLKR